MSSTYDGSWTCDINTEYVVGGTTCTDNTTHVTTTIGLPYGSFNILVGNDVACDFAGPGMQTSMPTYCTPYTGCNSPVNFNIYCWTKANTTPVQVSSASMDTFTGWTPSSRYVGGPLSFQLSTCAGLYPSGGAIQINWDIYDSMAGDGIVDQTYTCGQTVNAGGYLQ